MKNALKRGANTKDVTFLSMAVIVDMYYYYLELYNEFDVDKIFDWASPLKEYLIDEDVVNDYYYNIILDLKRGDYYSLNDNVEDVISFYEFLSKI